MRWRWWLLAAYPLLLLASHLVRSSSPPVVPAGPTLEVGAIGDPEVGSVRLAYREWSAGERSDAASGIRPTLLLLHGSPGSSHDFDRLAPLLADRFELVAPDLPGFGRSSQAIPDYSIRAHAEYVEILLRELEIERAHVLGFSMGGGVALELIERAPERVASLTLLASIGAVEFELLGNHHLNHAIHGAQLAALTLLHEGTPHFGLLDGSMLDRPYARNFYDTDQRPLRGALERLEIPTLILHGEHDPLVPVAAAREHARIVPQSELAILDTDHFTVFREADLLAGPIADFIDRVERGAAATRASAGEGRLAAAAHRFDPGTLPKAEGLTAFVWVLLLALATLVSEDLTCIAAGLLVAQGRIGLATAVFACALGIFVGDLALVALGRFGRRWLRRAPVRWLISEAKVEGASRWFRRRGAIVVLISRFTPGLRLPTFVAAGLLRVPLLAFTFYFGLAVLLWTPILVGVSALVGEPALEWFATLPVGAAWTLPLALLALWIVVGLVRALLTWRGRRLLVSRWNRWRHWEFWPPWLFYLPVVGKLAWLAARHRSPTLFTAANPGIPDGGFVGESKHQILEQLPAAVVARFELIPGGSPAAARRATIEGFLARNRLDFPVVLKPDVGERGRDVAIAQDWTDVEDYLRGVTGDTLVQEYVEGVELGVFYVRHPEEETGRIFSITEKRLISVDGDGESTLERLILTDGRAVSMAPTFLARHAERLAEVPAAGERVRLVDVGTHCRGALFLDGERFHTPELEAAIDRISRGFEGFHFGRFDLRAPSEEDLRGGRELRVLELNGVSSEATHIYDPELGLMNAYRTLFEQWELAFELGAANRERGVKPSGLSALMAVIGRWLASRTASHRPNPSSSSQRNQESR